MEKFKNIEVIRQIQRRIHNHLWFWFAYPWFKRCLLKDQSIYDLAPFRRSSWHMSAKYFSGRINGRKIFIKTDNRYKMLENEINIWTKLQYHNVSTPDLVNASECVGTGYMVSEFISGDSLFNYLQEDKLTLLGNKDVRGIAGQILSIIDGLDQADIVHRDITPKNIIITRKNNCIKATIIDYTFSIDRSVANYDKDLPKWLVILLGGKYRFKLGVWDDAYSAYSIVSEIQSKSSVDLSVILEKLESKIGANQYVA